MDLNTAHIFVHVIEHNSFTAASDALGVPKQTVSRKIAELENDLGVRLIERTTRHLRLTSHGERFFEYALRISELANKAKEDMVDASSKPIGRLRISAPPIFGELYLNHVLLEYMASYPNVNVEITYGGKDTNPLHDDYDLCFSAGPPPESSMVAQYLFPSWRCFFVSPSLIEEHGPIEHPSQLTKIPCLFYGEHYINFWDFINPQQENQPLRITPNFRLQSSNFWIVREATLKGLGVAMLPRSLCGYDLFQNHLIEILSDWNSNQHGVYALYPSKKQLNLSVKKLLNMIENHLSMGALSPSEHKGNSFQGIKLNAPHVEWIEGK